MNPRPLKVRERLFSRFGRSFSVKKGKTEENRRQQTCKKSPLGPICRISLSFGRLSFFADSDDAAMSFRDHAASYSGMIPPPVGGAFRRCDVGGFSGPGQA